MTFDLQAGHNKKVASGLLGGANSDLFHRYETEEGRALALQERYDRQRQQLDAMTHRLSQVVGEVEAVEVKAQQRIAVIRQQLERMDREEATMEGRIRERKRELVHLSTQLASNRIAMAFNFEVSEALGSSRAVTMAPEEMQDVLLGHSTYVDARGVTHRVEFTAAPLGGGFDQRSTHSPAESTLSPKKRGGAAAAAAERQLQAKADRNTILQKRAGFLLLDQAKAQVMRAMRMLDDDYQNGRVYECEYTSMRGPLQLRLGEIRRALEHIAGLAVPSSSAAASERRGTAAPDSPGSPVPPPTVESVLSLRPVADPLFSDKLTKQRRALLDLKRQIAEEEALVGQRAAMGDQRWVDALAARDMAEFAESRREQLAEVAQRSAASASGGSCSSRAASSTTVDRPPTAGRATPAAASAAPAAGPTKATDAPSVSSSPAPGSAAPQRPCSAATDRFAAKGLSVPAKPQRPMSANLLRRYSEGAKTILAQAGDTQVDLYARITVNAASGEAPDRPSEGPGSAVYRFKTHQGLEAAAMSTMTTFNRRMYM